MEEAETGSKWPGPDEAESRVEAESREDEAEAGGCVARSNRATHSM
jgi:hypothetical protein